MGCFKPPLPNLVQKETFGPCNQREIPKPSVKLLSLSLSPLPSDVTKTILNWSSSGKEKEPPKETLSAIVDSSALSSYHLNRIFVFSFRF